MLVAGACIAGSGRFLTAYGPAVGEILTGIAALIAAIGGLSQYRENSKLQRLKWLDTLYTRFYYEPTHKKIRHILDEEDETEEIRNTVADQGDDFTDYLNFFEFLAYLYRAKQLTIEEIRVLFDYYLDLLKRHASVMRYIYTKQNGYEQLCELLRALEEKNDQPAASKL